MLSLLAILYHVGGGRSTISNNFWKFKLLTPFVHMDHFFRNLTLPFITCSVPAISKMDISVRVESRYGWSILLGCRTKWAWGLGQARIVFSVGAVRTRIAINLLVGIQLWSECELHSQGTRDRFHAKPTYHIPFQIWVRSSERESD